MGEIHQDSIRDLLHPGRHFERLNNLFLSQRENQNAIIVGGGPSVLSIDPERIGASNTIVTNIAIVDPTLAKARRNCIAGVLLDSALLLKLLPTIVMSCQFPVFAGNSRYDNDLLLHYLARLGIFIIPSNNTTGLGGTFAEFSNGGNSGFAAIQLALLMGIRRIGLLGFDGPIVGSERVNYHVEYSKATTSTSLRKWIETLDSLASTFRSLGVEVLNLGNGSQLTRYDRITIDQWDSFVKNPPPTTTRSMPSCRRPSNAGANSSEYLCYEGNNRCFAGATNAELGQHQTRPS